MTETNIPQPPPPPPPQGQPAPAGEAESLRAELAKSRRRNKVLVTVAAVIGTLLVLLAGAGYMIYMRLSEVSESVAQTMSNFEQQLPAIQRDGAFQGQGVSYSTSMPVSSLGLFSGGMPGGQQAAFDPEQGERMFKAVQKYYDRPIVKEIMADLSKNPEMAAAFEGGRKGNPMAALMALQKAKGMEKVMMKYAARPEFMKLMMEVMSDPEIRPLMQGMPGGVNMPLPGARPGAAVPVNTRPATAQEPEEGAEEGEMTFDPSAISGPSKETSVRTKKLPPPVDSD